ncbi:MAG: cytochrome c3 family protein [Nitrospirota bacterium]|nr:cytochrome c3 family protein [Nitrospirota bacterium]
MKKWILFLVCSVFVLWTFGYSDAAEYAGSESCFKCHPDQYNDFKVSGHPYKIQKAEDAKKWALPLPKGYSWDDISYVIGGAHKKSRYMDRKGYIITMTGPNKDVPGKNQYNLETGTWSDYHPGEKKKYDCGRCHTTGYKKEGNQDGLEGITGTWAAPGVQCEACHGPAGDHVKSGDKAKIMVDKSAALCGQCHIRGAKDKLPAKGGFIQHHETFNEMSVSDVKAKQSMDCVTCHNPHKRAKFSIKKDCATCHGKQAESYKGKLMEKVGVKCVDCHMPRATKSATNKGQYEGDIRTHLFKINLDPKAEMFYKEPKLDKEGKQVMDKDGKPAMNEFAKGFVSVEFACLNCHKDKDKTWAIKKAKGIHK